MRVRSIAPLFALSLLAVAVACGSDTPSAPASSRADLNQAFVELGLPALSAATTTIVGVPAVAPSIGDRSGCAYAGASQSFACPTQTVGGLTVTASYSLLTASGTPQSAFDATTTSAVRTDVAAIGTVTNGATKLNVDARQTLTLSALLTERHVLDGTGTSKVNGTVAQGSTALPVAITTTTTITKLVLPPSTSATKWPLSGTIASESSTSLSGLPAVPSRVEVTFDGTSRVAVVVTIAGVTKRCTVDLASQAPSCG
ncbi:MAG: hypothetical protein ABI601_11610 [bacterium]